MSLNELTAHRYVGQGLLRTKRGFRSFRHHRRADVLPMGVHFHHWTLGFKQSSFNHIAQALRSHAIHVFRRSPLYQHALVPASFRIVGKLVRLEVCLELRPSQTAINLVAYHDAPFPCIRRYRSHNVGSHPHALSARLATEPP